MRRDLLAILSFANICYLRMWSERLTYTHADTFLMVTPPPPAVYCALMANVLLAAAAIFILSRLAKRCFTGAKRRYLEMAIVIGLCFPLNAVRAVMATEYPYLKSPLIALLGWRGMVLLGVCLLVAGAIAVFYYHRQVSRGVVTVLRALAPFCLVTFGQAAWRATHYDASGYANNPTVPLTAPAKQLPRVVWFIADEWDYRLTFEKRDPTLDLPELDRLRKQAIFSEHTFPPGMETRLSMPGYFTGRFVNHVRYDGPRELQLLFRNQSQERPWSAQPSVFQQARETGANTALVDWFEPTCRVLTGLNYCTWRPLAMQHNSTGDHFTQILVNQDRSLFETNLFSLFGRSLPTEQHTRMYHGVMGDATQLIGDPNYAFTVIHLPIPHEPHGYDRKTKTFTLGNSPYTGYVDSLALLDRTVGELRQTMERAGTWDSTTVLFTSDHHYRQDVMVDGVTDYRIPYILKLEGQKEGVAYSPAFNSILTGELLLAVLRGEVADSAAAVSWIDRNRSRFALH